MEAVGEQGVEVEQAGGTWLGLDGQHGLMEAAYGLQLGGPRPAVGVLVGHEGVEEADPQVAWLSPVAPQASHQGDCEATQWMGSSHS